MHNNYFFLRLISSQLNRDLAGFRIIEIFSQAKDELIISLRDGDSEKFIKAHLSPQFCCLSFPEIFNRAKKNSINLFTDVINHEIKGVIQIENDRSFYLQLENDYLLLFKMHGNRANIILFKGDHITEVFKSSLKRDYDLTIADLSRHYSIDKNTIISHGFDYKKVIPTLGKSFDQYFLKKDYSRQNEDNKLHLLFELMEYLKKPSVFIHCDSNGMPQLSLYRMSDSDEIFQNPVKANNTFFTKYVTSYYLEKEKTAIRNNIKNQIKKAEGYIQKATQKLDKLERSSNYKNLGDLIMANLHSISPHSSKIELVDFYTNQLVKIQLKSSLSPQLNAEKYYKKAKNQQLEIDTLTRNIENKHQHKEILMSELVELENAVSLKQISKKGKRKSKKIEPFYHTYSFMGYQILIGKNAKRNDQLTFQVARKDDLFLHAKDTSGSHVIIKKKTNQNIPLSVIERAASLAAYYSKNKNEALSRVLYTPKKYVRKAKGAPAGAVIVSREKVVLVKPELLQIRK